MTTTPEAARLAEEARKLAAKLRTPEVFHTQVSREWEEYATVERTRGPSHDAIYTADLLEALAALSQPDEARDAARYRWLRENAVSYPEREDALELVVPVKFADKWAAMTDAAIDAAMSKEQP